MNEWLALGIVVLLLYALSILIPLAIVIFLAVILIRAVAFKPKPQPKADPTPVDFDKNAAVESLRELVKCKTVSYMDPTLEDDAEFEKLISKLPALFGGLAVVFISKNAKLSVAPIILMLALFIFVPALNASTVGIMVPVGVVFTVIVARILYKRGVL